MADIITRLKLETKDFDANVRKAGKGVKDFEKNSNGLEKQLKGVATQMMKYASIGAVVSGAMKVMKDAFMASESSIDEWGRTVKGSEAAYNTFINTLNNQDWSNFFSNMSEAVTAARDLYDMFDHLGSMKVNNAPLIATLQAKLAELRLLKQDGQDVDEAIKKVSGSLASLKRQQAGEAKSSNRQGIINELIAGGMPKASAEKVVDQMLKGGQKFIDQANEKYKQFNQRIADANANAALRGGVMANLDENIFNAKERIQFQLVKAITERESFYAPFMQGYADAVSEEASIAAEQFKYNKWGKANYGGTSGASGKGTGKGTGKIAVSKDESAPVGSLEWYDTEISKLQKELSRIPLNVDPTSYEDTKNKIEALKKEKDAIYNPQLYTGMPAASPEGYSLVPLDNVESTKEGKGSINWLNRQISAAQNYLQLTFDGTMTPEMQFLFDKLREWTEQKKTLQLEFDFKEEKVKEVKELFDAASGIGEMADGFSELASAIEDAGGAAKGLKMAVQSLIMAEMIANFVKTLRACATPWDYIAAVAGGVASIAAAGVKFGGMFAEGGMVPGNYNGGKDNTYIYASPGEVILNRAQQNNLLSQLDGGTSGGRSTISGEQIVTVVNAYGRRTGRGEILR